MRTITSSPLHTLNVETGRPIPVTKAGLRIKGVPSFEARRKNGVSNRNSFRDGWRIPRIMLKEYLKNRSRLERR